MCAHNSGKFFIRYLLKDLLEAIAKDMRKNLAEDYDNLVVCYGGEGSGKSNAMYALLSTFDPNLNVEKCYTYDNAAFRSKIKEGGDIGRTFWMDEGSVMASNRDWNTVNNKGFVKILETCRSRHFTLGCCIPSLDRLDIYIREHRIRYAIHCEPMTFSRGGFKKRGYFSAYKKNDVTGVMELIGYGEYPQMPPEIKEIYEPMKAASQERLFKDLFGDEDEGPGSKYKKKYEEAEGKVSLAMLKLYDAGTSLEELQDMFGIESKKTLQNRLSKARQMV